MFLGKRVNKNNRQLDFKEIFHNKNIPILTLDERWLALFPEYDMPENIKILRDKLNELLKKQGRVLEEIKSSKRYKSQLMQEIITNMEVTDSMLGKLKEKKLEKNKRLILKVNDQLTLWEEELANLPYEIKQANEELMNATTLIFYDRLEKNENKLKQLDDDIARMRIELKEKILEKQDLEINSTSLYSYMHDVLGAKVMERLDEETSGR